MLGSPLTRIGGLIAASLALAEMASPAGATPTLVAGDQISWVAIEGEAPNPQPGAAFPVEMVIGPSDGNGFFPILQLTAFNAAGRCISCGVQFDLTHLFLSQGQTDLEISGSLTGVSRRYQLRHRVLGPLGNLDIPWVWKSPPHNNRPR